MVQYIVVVHIMAQNSIEFVFETIKYALIDTGSNCPPPPALIAPPPLLYNFEMNARILNCNSILKLSECHL